MKQLTNLALPAILALLALAGCDKAAPADPLAVQAVRTCKDTIEARASKPDSVSYRSADDAPVKKAASGQIDVTLKFSAKNDIGMPSNLVARCVVAADGKKLVSIDVKDSR